MSPLNNTNLIEEYLDRIKSFKKDLIKISPEHKIEVVKNTQKKDFSDNEIYKALRQLSEPLSTSYLQVKYDLTSEERVSWAGTAHEIREIVSHVLRLKAPDKDVTAQAWYRQEPNTNGPSQKQRVKFILQKQSAGSKQTEVTELVIQMENLIGSLVRATYSRASDAAHRLKDRKEANRLIKYFEAFANDLLDL